MKTATHAIILLLVLLGCSTKYHALKNELNLENGAYLLSPGLVLDRSKFFNTKHFKLGLIWHPSMSDKAILIADIGTSLLYKTGDIKELRFVMKDKSVIGEKLPVSSIHEFHWGIGLNLETVLKSHVYRGFYFNVSELKQALEPSNLKSIELITTKDTMKGDLDYNGYGSARVNIDDFIIYYDSIKVK